MALTFEILEFRIHKWYSRFIILKEPSKKIIRLEKVRIIMTMIRSILRPEGADLTVFKDTYLYMCYFIIFIELLKWD